MESESRSGTAVEKIGISAKGLDIGLRSFLSSIAPGLFLLFVVYLQFRLHRGQPFDFLNEISTNTLLFFVFLAIPAGFLINAIGYFLLGPLTRLIEGYLITCGWVRDGLITIVDWEKIEDHFKLSELGRSRRKWLLFRYECEGYLAICHRHIKRQYDHVSGMELLSRSVALLAIAAFLFVLANPSCNSDSILELAIYLVIALGFLLLSACDSLYIGLHCIRNVFIISSYSTTNGSVALSSVDPKVSGSNSALEWEQRLELLYKTNFPHEAR